MQRDNQFKAIIKLVQSAQPHPANTKLRREMIAELCKLIGRQLMGEKIESTKPKDISAPLPHLAPRVRQTLQYLLEGDSEKQIALKIGISQHTVHVYVKSLYKTMNVSSRGELLAKFVGKLVMVDGSANRDSTALNAGTRRKPGRSDNASRASA